MGTKVMYLNAKAANSKIGSSAISIEQVKMETLRMLKIAEDNVTDSFEAFRKKIFHFCQR